MLRRLGDDTFLQKQCSRSRPCNDNALPPPPAGRSLFPEDAVARIFRPSRSATTSGRGRTKKWVLVFERRSAPWVEPLMGWTAGDDTLAQVSLSFPTLQAAIDFAERQGLPYTVDRNPRDSSVGASGPAKAHQNAAEAVALPTPPAIWLVEPYGVGLQSAPHRGARGDRQGASAFASPFEAVRASGLTVEEKRAVLTDWWWNEYLLDVASTEGMPESHSPSRLHEVERALLALGEANRRPAPAAAPAGRRHAA